jgi:hypothetical protein
MAISKAQLRTLRLLNRQAAQRVYRSQRSAGEYVWVHEQSSLAVTATLHRLISSGHATLRPDDRDMAVITAKGRAALALVA